MLQRTARRKSSRDHDFQTDYVPSAAVFEDLSSRPLVAVRNRPKELFAQRLIRCFRVAVPTRRCSPPAEKWAGCIIGGTASQGKRAQKYGLSQYVRDAAANLPVALAGLNIPDVALRRNRPIFNLVSTPIPYRNRKSGPRQPPILRESDLCVPRFRWPESRIRLSESTTHGSR